MALKLKPWISDQEISRLSVVLGWWSECDNVLNMRLHTGPCSEQSGECAEGVAGERNTRVSLLFF